MSFPAELFCQHGLQCLKRNVVVFDRCKKYNIACHSILSGNDGAGLRSVDMAERLFYNSGHYDGRVSCIEHFCCPFTPVDGSTPVSSTTTWHQMLHSHSIT